MPPEDSLKDVSAAFEACLSDMQKKLEVAENEDDVMRILRAAKHAAAGIIGAADMQGAWDDVRVMQALSRLADAAMAGAVRFLLQEAHASGYIRLPARKTPEKDCGVCIIALGKWGARELNYSSDIDFMVIFDPQKSPVRDASETQAFFIRFTRALSRMLEERTQDGYVFRTDLRLRPDPGATPLAVSIAAAETYYGSLGQNWERAAMIKARAVAGDAGLGHDFMQMITAWIWRRNLDFAAIQDIHSIKRQINAKQGAKLRRARGENPFLDFNVKLGHGGIREIEFFVQTQQLIFGGKEPRLRAPDTLSALAMLEETGHVAKPVHEHLRAAYLFLRHAEHRLQMQDDRQTHSLPASAEAYADFTSFLGFAEPRVFTRLLEKHTACVKKAYAALFTESLSLTGGGSTQGNLVFTGVEDDPETLSTLARMGFCAPEKITAAVRGWHHGRTRAVRSERARQILTEITPSLLETLGKTPAPDDAFLRFDRFLSQLPSGVPIFSMFARNPQILGVVADVMGTAPALAEWLGARPQVLDGVLSQDFFGRLPVQAELQEQLNHLLETARDYQDVLDLARIWAREKRFHAGIHLLKGISSPAACGAYFADIASAVLNALVPRVEDDFAQSHGRFSSGKFVLLAMGSLAARDMASDSDLDLVALYHTRKDEPLSSGEKPLPPALYYIRLTQRVLSALSAPTAEGILYAVDTRLRPQGGDGPLAVQMDGFFEYQRRHAWTWEHMCLMRARVVYADEKTARATKTRIEKTLRIKRDAEKLKRDMHDMRGKIEKQFGGQDPWHMKYRAGGVTDIMFAVQYLTLKNAATHKLSLHADTADAINTLAKEKLLTNKDAKALAAAYRRAQAIQAFLRLAAQHPFDPKTAPPALLNALAKCVTPAMHGQRKKKQISFSAFSKETQTCFRESRTAYLKIFKA